MKRIIFSFIIYVAVVVGGTVLLVYYVGGTSSIIYSILIFIFASIIDLSLTYLENKKIADVIKTHGYSSTTTINYLEGKKDKCFFTAGKNGTYALLFNAYVMIEMYDDAERILNFYNKDNQYMFYAEYIYYLAKKENDKLDYVYNKLLNSRNKKLIVQKEQIVYIKELVFENKYNPILEKSNYEYVKKLCANYKKKNA